MDQIQPIMTSCVVDQKETVSVIRTYYETHSYLLDPHTAVAGAGLNQKLNSNPDPSDRFCCLCTATPAKFPLTVLSAIGLDDDAEGTNRAKLFDRYLDLKLLRNYDIFWPRDAMDTWETALREKIGEISAKNGSL